MKAYLVDSKVSDSKKDKQHAGREGEHSAQRGTGAGHDFCVFEMKVCKRRQVILDRSSARKVWWTSFADTLR